MLHIASEIQRSDGVMAIRKRKKTDAESAEVGVRAPQQLERRTPGVDPVDEIVVVLATRPANGLGWNNDNSLDFALVSIGLDANKPTLQMD